MWTFSSPHSRMVALFIVFLGVLSHSSISFAGDCNERLSVGHDLPTLKQDPVALYELVRKRLHQSRPYASDPLEVTLGLLAEPFINEAERRLARTYPNAGMEGVRKNLLAFITATRKSDYPYIDILRIAEAYARLRMCEDLPNMCNKDLDIRGLNAFEYDARLLLGFGDFVYWPTFENLNLYEFIRTRSVRLYMLEVKDTPTKADNSEMDPYSYLMHDKNHGRQMAIADHRLVEAVGQDMALKGTHAAWNWIARRWKESENTKEAKIVLFSYVHENGSLNLVEVLKPPASRLKLGPQALHFVRTELSIALSVSQNEVQTQANQILELFLNIPPSAPR